MAGLLLYIKITSQETDINWGCPHYYNDITLFIEWNYVCLISGFWGNLKKALSASDAIMQSHLND